MRTVTQEGVTPSQPGWCVSVQSTPSTHTLCVFRVRPALRNKFGGHGVHQYGDHYNAKFATAEEAWEFALSRGYLRTYQSHLRPARKKLAHDLRRIVWICPSFPEQVGKVALAERDSLKGEIPVYRVTFQDGRQTYAVYDQFSGAVSRCRSLEHPDLLGYRQVADGSAYMDDGTTLPAGAHEFASTWDYMP